MDRRLLVMMERESKAKASGTLKLNDSFDCRLDPNSVHTLDGQSWGNCTPTAETCTNPNGGALNGNIAIRFCCSTL